MRREACAARPQRGDPGASRANWRGAAFEAALDAMLIFDDAGACVDANAAARRLFDGRTSGPIGLRIGELAGAVRADPRLRWESAPVGGGEGECELLVAEGVRLRARYVLVAEIAVDRHLLILRALVPPLAVPAAQRRLEGLLDAAEDAVALCTLERRFARLNRAAVRLYGLSEREAIGRRLELIVPDERASELAAAWEAAIRDEPAAPIEFEWSGGNRRAIVSLALRPLTDPAGNVTAVAAVARDVTVIRRLEAQLEAARAGVEEVARRRAEALAELDHALRTPLNAAVGATELLAATSLTAEQSEFVSMLRLAVDGLTAAIDKLLDFSVIATGVMEFDAAAFEPRRLVEEVCRGADEERSSAGVPLSWTVEDAVPEHVYGNGRLLRRALVHLIRRALELGPAAQLGVAVKVDRAAQHPGQLGLRFELAAVGQPAPPEEPASPAVEASAAALPRHPELDLTVARELIGAVGGAIGGDALDRGRTLWLTVPMRSDAGGDQPDTAPAGGETAAGAAGDARGNPVRATRTRVLVVGDDQASRLIAVRLMRARGLEVDAAATGTAALEAVAKAAYDLIFIDCEMDGLDAYRTTREIRRREQGARHTPIVAMAARATPSDTERCHAAGMDLCFVKPIRPAGLDYIIARTTAGAVA
jgi:PAS domain S-box-containing protein